MRRVLLLLSLARAVAADEPSVQKATNPFALVNTLQLEPRFVVVHAGGNEEQLELLVGVAYHALWIPGVKVSDVYSFARLEMYGESKNQPNHLVIGLEDWLGLLLAVKPFSLGSLALGVATELPTATNAALGAQEFELGPATGAMLTRVHNLQVGFLGRFLFSVAGATPDLGYVLFQPLLTYHLPKNFFFKSDGIMNFDFRHSPHATVPVNLHLGHGFTDRLVLSAVVEGVTTGSGRGNVTVKLNLNYFNW
jgi:hypothetical protein